MLTHTYDINQRFIEVFLILTRF